MRFAIILLLLHFLFIGLLADDDDHGHRHLNKELSHLDLSKKQRKQIKRILREFRGQIREYRELKEDIEDKRKDIFLEEVFNADKLNELNFTLDTKAHNIENKLLKKIHTILNRKQRRRFIHYFDDWEVE